MKIKNKNGFTLLEIVTAIGLFSFSLLSIILLIGFTLEMGKLSEHRATATAYANTVIERIRSTADSNGLDATDGVGSINWNTWADNNVQNSLDNQNISVALGSGNPLPVSVTVNWTEKGKGVSHSFSTLVTQR